MKCQHNLGDVGTGKSFLSKMIADQLAEEFLRHPLDSPIPILVDLRNADRQLSLEGLILTHFANAGISDISFDIFQYALSQGKIVLILDGFDEMASRVTPQITSRNFNELIRTIQGKAKVILTCRTHYFKSRTEEEHLILGHADKYESDSLKELYWDLISRKGYKIVYLQPFNKEQIESYVSLTRPKSVRKSLSKIYETYNLIELSQRPMLLNMIVQAIDKIGSKEINQASLYEVFTDVWIHRDKWRDVVTPENKLEFLTVLAQKLWKEGISNIHYSHLNEYIKNNLSLTVSNEQEELEIDNEIRTASFLTRDKDGNYGFAHKSYQEYFFARYLAHHFKNEKFDCLYTRKLTPEVISFLCCLIDTSSLEKFLEKILLAEYSSNISENALILLYGIKRDRLLKNENNLSELIIEMPEGIQLSGGQFEEVVLEGIQLIKSNLSGASFKEALLSSANFSNSNLVNANFTRSYLLINSNLQQADLTDCIFNEANLEKSNITGSILKGSNFSKSYLNNIIFQNTNLTDAVFSGANFSEDLADQLNLKPRLSKPDNNENLSIDLQLWKKIIDIKPRLLFFCRRHKLGITVDEEDLVSDFITKIFSNSKTVAMFNNLPEADLFSFCHSEIRKLISNDIKRQNNLLSTDLPDEEFQIESENDIYTYESVSILDDLDRFIVNTEFQDDIEKRIFLDEIYNYLKKNMKEAYIQIFEDYFIEGNNITEISQKLNIPKTQVHYMLVFLNKTIESNFSKF